MTNVFIKIKQNKQYISENLSVNNNYIISEP